MKRSAPKLYLWERIVFRLDGCWGWIGQHRKRDSRARDERLYRVAHKTFEEYCRERWGWSHRHADRQIEAAQIVDTLGPMGPKPETERQARELAPLPPDSRRVVWSARWEAKA